MIPVEVCIDEHQKSIEYVLQTYQINNISLLCLN